MIKRLKKERSLGIKPSWAFVFSKTRHRAGRLHEQTHMRKFNDDERVISGTFINSLILLTKSTAPIHDQRLLDLPLESTLDAGNFASIHVEAPFDLSESIWTDGIPVDNDGPREVFRLIPRGDPSVVGENELIREDDANSKSYTETYVTKHNAIEECRILFHPGGYVYPTEPVLNRNLAMQNFVCWSGDGSTFEDLTAEGQKSARVCLCHSTVSQAPIIGIMHMETLHDPKLLLSWKRDGDGLYDCCLPTGMMPVNADVNYFPYDQALGKMYKPTRYLDAKKRPYWERLLPCCGKTQCSQKTFCENCSVLFVFWEHGNVGNVVYFGLHVEVPIEVAYFREMPSHFVEPRSLYPYRMNLQMINTKIFSKLPFPDVVNNKLLLETEIQEDFRSSLQKMLLTVDTSDRSSEVRLTPEMIDWLQKEIMASSVSSDRKSFKSACMFGHDFDRHFHSSDSQRMDNKNIDSSIDDGEDDTRSVGTSMSCKSLRRQRRRERDRKNIEAGLMSPVKQIAKFFKNDAWTRMRSYYICRLPDDDPRLSENPSWREEREKMKPMKFGKRDGQIVTYVEKWMECAQNGVDPVHNIVNLYRPGPWFRLNRMTREAIVVWRPETGGLPPLTRYLSICYQLRLLKNGLNLTTGDLGSLNFMFSELVGCYS